MRPSASRNCGFETSWKHGCVCLVTAVCCQIQVSSTGRSLVQRIPTERGVSVCDLDTSTIMDLAPIRTGAPQEKENFFIGRK